MPHKHKRRKDENGAELYDLPPTSKARPLKVGKPGTASKSSKEAARKNGSNSNVNGSSYGKDDTPRAFQRLLQYQKTGRGVSKGLDAGIDKRGKKRKRSANDEANDTTKSMDTVTESIQGAEAQTVPDTQLKIQPNERFSDFIARVDQALPLAGISTKGKKVEGIKERRTKHDKRLRKLQDGWRADEARIREREEEEREVAEEEWEEKLAGMDREARATMLAVQQARLGKRAKSASMKAGKKKQKQIGEVDDGDDEDPWAVLNERREAPKGVFDVVQAPPTFKKLPREVFKANDVPKVAGSLRKREELGQTRADIIKGYRAMMAGKRS